MKKILIFLFSISFICLPPAHVESGSKKANKYIHPSFAVLLKMYPRNKRIVAPMVPRISAREAYKLFMNNKAILFGSGVGMNNQHTILGTIKLPDHKIMSPSLLKKLKTIKNQHILVFCS